MDPHTICGRVICEQAFVQLALQKAAARTFCLKNLFISNFDHSIMKTIVHALIGMQRALPTAPNDNLMWVIWMHLHR